MPSLTPVSASVSPAGPRRRARLWLRLRPFLRFKLVLGLGIVLFVLAVALLAPLIAPFDPGQQDLRASLRAPEWLGGAHVLGTDHLGRDILSRIIYGTRVSGIIAVTVVSRTSGSHSDSGIARSRAPCSCASAAPTGLR